MLRTLLFISFAILLFGSRAADIVPILQTGHSDRITAIDFGDESSYFITADLSGTLISWNIENRQQVFERSGFTGGVSCMDYHEAANLLVVGTYGRQVFIFQLDSSAHKPIEIFEFAYTVNNVIISPDGSKVAMASADYSLALYHKGQLEVINWQNEVRGLDFDANSNWLYFGDYNGNLLKVSTESAFELNAVESIYSQERSISEMRLSPDGKFLAFGTDGVDAGTLALIHLSKKKLVYEVQDYVLYHQVSNNSIHFLDNRHILYINDKGGISEADWKKSQTRIYLNAEMQGLFALSPDKKWLATADQSLAILRNSMEPTQAIMFQGKVDKPKRIMGHSGSRLLVEYNSGIRSWDLEELKLHMIKERFYDHAWNYYSASPDLSSVDYIADKWITRMDGTGISLNDYRSTRILLSAFSYDNRYYARLKDNGTLEVYDLSKPSSDSMFSRAWTYNERYARENINRLVFMQGHNELAILHDYIDIINLDSLKQRRIESRFRQGERNLPAVFNPADSTFHAAAHYVAYTSYPYEGHPDKASEWRSVEIKHIKGNSTSYKNVMNGITFLYDLKSMESDNYIVRDAFIDASADVSALLYDSVNQSIVMGYSDGSMTILYLDSGVYQYEWLGTATERGLKDMSISDDSRFLFLLLESGKIEIRDRYGLHLVCTLVGLENDEYLVLNPNGYYKRSKNATEGIAFMNDGQLSRLSQYDQMFNRPYLIMESLGFASQQKIELIKRLAFQEEIKDSSDLSYEAPLLELLKVDKIDFTTSDSFIIIHTEVQERTHALAHMQIWVNGVPQFDIDNAPRASYKSGSWKSKWKIALRRGENAIRLVCFDTEGIESNERQLKIRCNKPYVKPNLYIATISISEYMDSSMDLTYAVKDGRDFSRLFIGSDGKRIVGFPSRFNKIFVDSFYNEFATIENIKTWRNRILKSRPDDYVMLFVSGHGLLDDNLNFWFATYDVDFDNPSQRGISFYDLESLLVGIPAQQKLFLMDACHSGEVLKDELSVDSNYRLPNGSKGRLIAYSYKGTKSSSLDGLDVNKSELRQELFSNYESRSGATVISAAAGNSFALESPQWSNGVFTYNVISGMINRFADLNQDGNVTVVELSKYVSGRVKEDTGGMQIPNDRQENIDNNFRVW